MFNFDKLTYEQLRVERAHRQVDQVLMKALANNSADAGREVFRTLEQLTMDNVSNAVKALRLLGADVEYTDVADRFAERFAYYWPELDARYKELAAFYSKASSKEAAL